MAYAMVTLWHAVGGWDQVVAATHQVVVDPALAKVKGDAIARLSAEETARNALSFWDTGIVAGLGFAGNVKHVLETEYTVWSAFLASVFVTMATHGTDQDMVQRMLTAPDVRRSRRSLILSGLADLPIALSFTLIGVLLWVYYRMPEHAIARPGGDVFVNYILREMPVGIRGIMAAGLFATAMGSLSTALNALATSFTRDFYLGVFRPQATSHEQMMAARVATAVFAVILAGIGIGTAWVHIVYPNVRIIPIVLGSFGYTYGPLLGIFLVGMVTRTRGSCRGNLLAMLIGFLVVGVLSDLFNDAAGLFGGKLYRTPPWLPIIEFPWRICFGTVVTAGVALCFRTPKAALA
jgi:Na+/proline symporter